MMKKEKFSRVDMEILEILEKNSKTSLKEISKLVGVPPSTGFERIKKLEKKGVIKQYTIKIDLEKLGFNVKSFILVKIDPYSKIEQKEVIAGLAKLYEITEAHIVSGTQDILLKASTKSTKALGELITSKIRKTPGVLETKTITVFHTEKE